MCNKCCGADFILGWEVSTDRAVTQREREIKCASVRAFLCPSAPLSRATVLISFSDVTCGPCSSDFPRDPSPFPSFFSLSFALELYERCMRRDVYSIEGITRACVCFTNQFSISPREKNPLLRPTWNIQCLLLLNTLLWEAGCVYCSCLRHRKGFLTGSHAQLSRSLESAGWNGLVSDQAGMEIFQIPHVVFNKFQVYALLSATVPLSQWSVMYANVCKSVLSTQWSQSHQHQQIIA